MTRTSSAVAGVPIAVGMLAVSTAIAVVVASVTVVTAPVRAAASLKAITPVTVMAVAGVARADLSLDDGLLLVLARAVTVLARRMCGGAACIVRL